MTKISELFEKLKKIPLVSFVASTPEHAREQLYIHAERAEAYNRLAAVSNSGFATLCWKEVKAEAYTYDVKMEIARMNCASFLLAHGVSQEDVIVALEHGNEFIVRDWICSP